MLRRCLAEFLGIFVLVFSGCGAIIVNDLYGGVVSHVGIALTFGLVVMALIYALGSISGAHFNPAVTIAFSIAGLFPKREVLFYVASQCFGAIVAAVILKFLFVSHVTLGATVPSGSWLQAFVMEFILSFMLMFVIIQVSTGSKEEGVMAGVAVGAMVGLEAMFAGPVTGASMNPARSLGPALVSGHMEFLWVYLVATTLGACVAVLSCLCIKSGGCCRG